MKNLGRIFLLIVGVALIATSLPSIITGFKSINAIGWGSQEAITQSLSIIFSLTGSFVNIFCALIALICALVGKATFLLGLIALIMIGLTITNVILVVQSGAVVEWYQYVLIGLDFILPILYFLGTLFVSFSK